MKKENAYLETATLYQRGLSLIELMVSLTIGLILLAGLSLLFVESSRSHRELSEASKQIENGRYALQLLTDELHLAGFYGRFSGLSTITIPAAPDPCEVNDTTAMHDALPVHIQGYAAANSASRPTIASAACAAYLTSANLKPGSDVFVIRRADTKVLTQGTDTTTTNEIYIQASTGGAEIQKGNGGAVTAASKADGTAADIFGFCTPQPCVPPAAPIRKFHVDIYFVAPCSMPSGGGANCTGSSDDGGAPIPTLKRLQLTSAGGATVMSITSLVEGIETMNIDYGIDSDGDGAPDSYLRTPTAPPADWANVVSANLYLLSRNTLLTGGYTDTKTYAMGLVNGSYAPGGSYKRHLYSASVRLINASMRREIP